MSRLRMLMGSAVGYLTTCATVTTQIGLWGAVCHVLATARIRIH